MPGRIEGCEPLLASAVVLPIWRRKLIALLKLDKKDK
jgi:hypothetical protein